MKKSELVSKIGSRKIATAVEGTYNNLPAYRVELEGGSIGFFSKERFEVEAPKWDEDANGDVLLPANYRIAKSGYWTPFDRATTGAGAFKLVGEA